MTGTHASAAQTAHPSGLVNERVEAGIFHIELNRPETGNTANQAFADQLLASIQRAQAMPDVRVLLLSAAGRHFMAGGDLGALGGDAERTMALVDTVNQAIAALNGLAIPIVCAVQGLVAGGGLGLALSADILIAEEGARFTVGSPVMGLSPDAGTTWQLVRWVGQRKAVEMSLLCTMLDAQAALDCGLINEIAPPGGLMDVARARATRLATGASLALQQTKQLLRTAASNALAVHIEEERRAFSKCLQSTDFPEGLAAMLEKRKPRFA